MTSDELARLAELERAATEGPWYDDCGLVRLLNRRDQPHCHAILRVLNRSADGNMSQRGEKRRINTEMLCALRNYAPALIALAREAFAARKAIDTIRGEDNEGHPLHTHERNGVWDGTNMPCDECAAWNAHATIRTANEAKEQANG